MELLIRDGPSFVLKLLWPCSITLLPTSPPAPPNSHKQQDAHYSHASGREGVCSMEQSNEDFLGRQLSQVKFII